MGSYPDRLPPWSWDGYGYHDKTTGKRTEMDAGPARVRQTVRVAGSIISVRGVFTPTQLAYFEGWYRHEIDDGVAWFDVALDVGQGMTAHNARFSGKYSVSKWGWYWVVQATLEVKTRSILPYEDWLAAMDETEEGDGDIPV